MFGGLGLRAPNRCHYGYVAIVSERHNRTPNYEVSSVHDVKPDCGVFSRHCLSHSAPQSKVSAI